MVSLMASREPGLPPSPTVKRKFIGEAGLSSLPSSNKATPFPVGSVEATWGVEAKQSNPASQASIRGGWWGAGSPGCGQVMKRLLTFNGGQMGNSDFFPHLEAVPPLLMLEWCQGKPAEIESLNKGWSLII